MVLEHDDLSSYRFPYVRLLLRLLIAYRIPLLFHIILYSPFTVWCLPFLLLIFPVRSTGPIYCSFAADRCAQPTTKLPIPRALPAFQIETRTIRCAERILLDVTY